MTTVGAIIATLLPVPLLLISPNVGVMQILLAVVLPTTIHVIVGHGIEPKVRARYFYCNRYYNSFISPNVGVVQILLAVAGRFTAVAGQFTAAAGRFT